MKKTNMKRFTLLALFIAIEIVISVIPFLGFIPLGFINATTLHIPVIIAAIILGKKEGAIVGFVFGLLSVMKHTMEPSISSFAFSPFISIGGTSGNFASLLVAIVPRICIGYFSGWVYELLTKRHDKDSLAIGIAAIVGSLTNTILVLGGIYLFFAHAYASAVAVSYNALVTFLMGIIATSGIVEAIVAVVIALPICKVARKVITL